MITTADLHIIIGFGNMHVCVSSVCKSCNMLSITKVDSPCFPHSQAE